MVITYKIFEFLNVEEIRHESIKPRRRINRYIEKFTQK
jgi:hypothetical protein